MESRFRIFLLSLMLAAAVTAKAADQTPVANDRSMDQIIQQEPVVQPKVKRRKIKISDIQTNNLELTAFAGLLSIEDFGVKPVYGLRVDYHVTEDFFFQGTYGLSKAGTTSYERLSGSLPLLSDADRKYSYYDISIGYNLLPGEAFIGRGYAYNTALYILAGAGATKFAGDNRFTATVGGGYRINIKDWFGVHLDFRDHIFNIDVTGESKNTHNFETTLGFTYVF